MTNEIVGVAIGVVFVFVLFALFLSTALEAVSAAMKLRGRALRVAIARLIDDPAMGTPASGFGLIHGLIGQHDAPASQAEQSVDNVDPEAPERHEVVPADGDPQPMQPVSFADVFSHPLVAGAAAGAKPSYVPDANFTTALLHTLLQGKPEASIEALAERVALLPPGPVRSALESALLDAQGDWKALRAGIDRWYANAMDRLSGEYKRFSQLVTFVLGLVLAASFNIDAVALARQLYADPALRSRFTEQAAAFVEAHANDPRLKKPAGGAPASSTAGTKASAPNAADASAPTASDVPPAASAASSVLPAERASNPDADAKAFQDAVDRFIQQRDLLVKTVPGATSSAELPCGERIRQGLLGWVITALAGMLGAPFWFDLLQKLTNLRGTGPKPKSTAELATETQ